MEYFDVLDENGNKTGLKKSREEVHRDGDWHKAVYVWIVNSKGELLLQKRSPIKDSHPNFWDVSSAGHILAGETSLQTVIKETKEELGLNLEKKDLEFLFPSKSSVVLNERKFINNSHYDTYLVHKDIDPKNLKIQKEEISAVKLIDFRELEKIIKSKDPNFVPHHEYPRLFRELHKRFD